MRKMIAFLLSFCSGSASAELRLTRAQMPGMLCWRWNQPTATIVSTYAKGERQAISISSTCRDLFFGQSADFNGPDEGVLFPSQCRPVIRNL
jgi:hypothetical protein